MKYLHLNILKNLNFIFIVFLVMAVLVSIQQTFYHEPNNFKIFYSSLKHLIQKGNLYAEYPTEYYDHFIYSPSFPIIFSPFFVFPFKLSAFFWHIFFAAVWVLAVYKMPLKTNKKVFIYWYTFQELITALGNSQTNPLIAAIPLFAFACFEKEKTFWAALFIILGFEVKIYSIVAGALFLLYDNKGKFILSCLFWATVFSILPLLITTPGNLLQQYYNWYDWLVAKTAFERFGNLSIHRLVHQFFLPGAPTMIILGIGIVIFCSVFIHLKAFAQQNFKMLLLSSVLIFQIIFNPAVESAAFITAVTGVTIWWLHSPQKTIDYILVIACFILTVMGPTDFIPRSIKSNFFQPYALKVWPCVLIWFRVIYLMHAVGFANRLNNVEVVQKRI